MAIVRGGLFGLHARGQYAKTLNFQGNKQINICTRYHKPGGSPSPLQQNARQIGSFVKMLLNLSISIGYGVMESWHATLRKARKKNTVYGETLRQTWRFLPIISNSEFLYVTKIQLVYADHEEWDIVGTYAKRAIVPIYVTYTFNVSTKRVVNWRIYGYRVDTQQSTYVNIGTGTRPLAEFQYARFWVKTESGEEFLLYPYCFNWTSANTNRTMMMMMEKEID